MSRRRRRSRLAALVTGAALVTMALGGCGRELAGHGGEADLPVLRIGVQPRNDGTTGIGLTAFPLRGTLPAAPDRAVVYRFPDTEPPESAVSALANALGVTAAQVRHEHGWERAGPDGVLRVRAGGAQDWSYSRSSSECPVYAVDVDSPDPASLSSCAGGGPVAPGATASPGAPTVPVPTDAQVRSTIAALLDALGRTPGDARIVGGTGTLRTVVVDLLVEGHPTVGARTIIDVDSVGVVGALGHLATPSAGAAYPVVSAQAALERLRSQPQPALAIACPQSGTAAPQRCLGGPTEVTGATLGLQLADDAGSPLLVPAWLFTVRGSAEPIAVVAVADQFLADPTSPGSGDASTSPGSSAGSEPGSGAGTPIPPSEVPLPGSSAATGQTSAVTAVSTSADGRTLTLIGWGGVCATYAGQAQETSSQVEVSILATPTIGPDQGCIDLAKQIAVDVLLDAPLDGRLVVDGVSHQPLPTG